MGLASKVKLHTVSDLVVWVIGAMYLTARLEE